MQDDDLPYRTLAQDTALGQPNLSDRHKTLAQARLEAQQAIYDRANSLPMPPFPPKPTREEYLQVAVPSLGKIEAAFLVKYDTHARATDEEIWVSTRRIRADMERVNLVYHPLVRRSWTHAGQYSYVHQTRLREEGKPEQVGRPIEVRLEWEGAEYHADEFITSLEATHWYGQLHPDQQATVEYQTFEGFALPGSVVVLCTYLLYCDYALGVAAKHQVEAEMLKALGEFGMHDSATRPAFGERRSQNWFHDQVRGFGIKEIKLTR